MLDMPPSVVNELGLTMLTAGRKCRRDSLPAAIEGIPSRAFLALTLCENALRDMIISRFVGDQMKRFVEGADREQSTLFPECLEDWVDENNPVRVIDVFVDELNLGELRFRGVEPKVTGRHFFISTAISTGSS
jgi:hypothetical protein